MRFPLLSTSFLSGFQTTPPAPPGDDKPSLSSDHSSAFPSGEGTAYERSASSSERQMYGRRDAVGGQDRHDQDFGPGADAAADVQRQVQEVGGSIEDALMRARERRRSLSALSSLLDASHARQSGSSTDFVPPPLPPASPASSASTHSPPMVLSRYHASPHYYRAVPDSLTDFAAQYPFVTIFALGSACTAAFLGSAAGTALLWRRVAGRARAKQQPFGLPARLDDMERRLAEEVRQGYLAQRVERRREVEGLKEQMVAMQRAVKDMNTVPGGISTGTDRYGGPEGKAKAPAMGMGSGTQEQKQGGYGDVKLNAEAFRSASAASASTQPVITSEARLRQVLNEVLQTHREERVADGGRPLTEGLLREVLWEVLPEERENYHYATGQDKTGWDERVESIADRVAGEVERRISECTWEMTRRLQRAHPGPFGPNDVANFKDAILQALREAPQVQASLKNAGRDRGPLGSQVGDGLVMSVGELQQAVQGIKAGYEAREVGGVEARSGSEGEGEKESELSPGIATDAIKAEDEVQRLLRPEGRNDTLGIIVGELGKAFERHANEDTSSGATGDASSTAAETAFTKEKPGEVEDHTARIAEHVAPSFHQTAQAPPSSSTSPASKQDPTSHRLGPASIKDHPPSAAASTASSTSPSSAQPAPSAPASQDKHAAKPRQPTPLPKTAPTPQSSPSSSMHQFQALYGVDDSGHWGFTLCDYAPDKGWHDVPIVLSKRKEQTQVNAGHYWRGYSQSMHSVSYRLSARIFFYPEADMIELDGWVWRCGREGGRHVIREKISPAA